jgi:hypothetical protein
MPSPMISLTPVSRGDGIAEIQPRDRRESSDLYPAYQLYENKSYGRRVDRIDLRNVYILSAGWRLDCGNFLTPYYDITFSPSAESYKRRRKSDHYDHFRIMPNDVAEEILFFGEKDYLPLFDSLTDSIRTKKKVFYNSAQHLQVTGYDGKRFETTTGTNWHYECANAFPEGAISTD